MAEAVKEAATKKRQAKPGTRRVTVNLSEEAYKVLVGIAEKQLREPNNMLSFMLAMALPGIFKDFEGIFKDFEDD